MDRNDLERKLSEYKVLHPGSHEKPPTYSSSYGSSGSSSSNETTSPKRCSTGSNSKSSDFERWRRNGEIFTVMIGLGGTLLGGFVIGPAISEHFNYDPKGAFASSISLLSAFGGFIGGAMYGAYIYKLYCGNYSK